MNSAKSSRTARTNSSAPTQAAPLCLSVRGLGNVIPFKNRKRIAGKNRNRLITEPNVKRQMKAITDAFVSQVISALATAGGETWTAAQRRSWIVSRMPADDCWTCVPDERATAELVPHGEEGADVTIEVIQ